MPKKYHQSSSVTSSWSRAAAMRRWSRSPRDFDVSPSSLKRWLRQADVEDGVVEGQTTTEQHEVVRLRRENRRLQQEVEVLRRATAYFAKDAAPVIVHTDRGSQFRSRKLRAALRRHGLVGSMGRVAAAADNAAMESWFSLLQKNVLNRQKTWSTHDELRLAIVWWTVHTYNTRRRQRALGKMTPVAYELMLTGTPLVEAA